MALDSKDAIEALVRDGESLEEIPRANLEAALQAAYDQGYEEMTQETREDPPLEVNFFRELMQCLPDYVYFKDCESRFVTTNRAHAAQLGKPVAEIIGKTDFDFFKPAFAKKKREDECEILRTGEGFAEPRLEHHFLANEVEKWTLTSKHPWRDNSGRISGTFGLSRDITSKVRAEQALAEQHRLMQTLINVLPCRIFVRDREHRFRLINDEYRKFLGIRSDDEVIGHRFDRILEPNRIQAIANEDETIMNTGVPVLRRIMFDISPVVRGRWVSISKVPLRGGDDRIEGIVGVAFDISAQKEAEARVRATGNELAQKNQQIESELGLARKLQVAFATFGFPTELKLAAGNHVHTAYLYEPSVHLAGDFFQLLQINDHSFAAFICDVMGHGVRSALVTAVIRGLIEENRADLCYPDQLFSHLNGILSRLAQDPDFPRFVTATLALFDTQSSTIRLVNAGHPPILALNDNEDDKTLAKVPLHRDPALGLLPQFTYRISECPLKTNCSYILYTDGIIEETDESGEQFGLDGIRDALTGLTTREPEALLRRLETALAAHAGRSTFSDDVCVMALSIQKQEPNAG